MNPNQVNSAKEEALESLGRLLPSYSSLQEKYNSQVHLPDYRSFSREWEESLYRPIRDAAKFAINRHGHPEGGALLYCAPGPHAPLLHDDRGAGLAFKFDRISLLDIDAAALRSAKSTVKAFAGNAEVEEIALDFSGSFGQRLCDAYSNALGDENDAAAVAHNLADVSVLCSSIFFDEDKVLDELCTQLDLASGGRRYTLSVSEMVASFTGTAVWLAFRSALYQRFARHATPRDLDSCLQAATLLWQEFNERFLNFHLRFLGHQLDAYGSLLLVFDSREALRRSPILSV